MSLDEESLFDAYSDQALRGDAPSPEEFLAAHPTASAELRASLARIFQRSPRGGAVANGELPFERLGEFRLVKRLGGGGMGIVFLAVQESLGREVALKILRPELQGSAVAAERFRREARALAELRHENLVTIFGGGEEHGVRYLAMELVQGESLDELLREGTDRRLATIPIARRVRWIAGLARGLQHAHERGVVHRDVKPSNVRITPEDCARLLDFGLARRHDGSERQEITLTESFAGSPSFAAPEQIQQGGAIDARTDVYALGVTLYQCLTGKLPFEGATVEQLFHRILAGMPAPPRRLVPELPRDLELVTLKAMERRPEQRYATAAELANDLEAVLELRPVSARPPGALERVARGLRAHPLLATACATGMLAALTLVVIVAAQRRTRERERLEEAARLVATARSRVGDYRNRRASLATVEAHVVNMQKQMTAMHFTAQDYSLLDRYEAQLEQERRNWEQTYYEVLDLLRNAERLDPQLAGADAVRGELFLARYQEALAQQDPVETDFFRELAARSDPTIERTLAGEVKLDVRSDPPGADVHLFRFVEHSRLVEGGQPRMVAVPVQDEPPAAPLERWALRVLRDAPPLLAGDHVFEIEGAPIEGSIFVIDGGGLIGSGERLVAVDGAPIRDDYDVVQLEPREPRARRFDFEHDGQVTTLEGFSLEQLGITVGAARRFGCAAERDAVQCRLVRDGAWLDATLPPGAPVRTTARPVLPSPHNRIGATPVSTSQPRGEYLVLLRSPGHEETRVVTTTGIVHELDVRLPRLGETPDGFVFVPNDGPEPPDDFWIMEREVDCGEWREFLRDPAIRAKLAVLGRSRYVPRMTGQPNPLWERDPEGTWTWPKGWRDDWPIVGVSFPDAVDYVAWRNARAQAAGEPWRYALPKDHEHWRAAIGRTSWSYAYGLRLRPHWSRCCYARPNANLGSALEFPVDESPYGVFEFTGGALEWLDAWYDEPRGMRMLAGGAWGQATPERLRVTSGIGVEPEFTTGETGLRLVIRRADLESSR